MDMISQIDQVTAQFQMLRQRSGYEDLSDLHGDGEAYVVRLRAAIERLAPVGSAYRKEMQVFADDRKNSQGILLRAYLGILKALREDILLDWHIGMAEILHASTFSDFLEQAEDLADKGYKDAAAVITGSALEAHLRLLCAKNSITVVQPSGAQIKADTMNAELCKANAYEQLEQKAVTAWLGLRNAAAHGEYGKYTDSQVKSLIPSVRDFIIRHPA